jgi:hypothetical protein
MTPAEQIATWQRARDEQRARTTDNPNAQACRRRRDTLRAASLCIFCGHNPADSPSPLCRECRERQSAPARARYLAARGTVSVRRYTRRQKGRVL